MGGRESAVADVAASISGHVAVGGRESDSKRRLLTELVRLTDPFDRDSDPVHVTGSAVIAGRRGTILHIHKKLHRWIQPGGHLEADEMPYEAALRESEEETGLKLEHPDGSPRLIHVDVHPAAEGHLHLDLRYLLIGPDEDPRPPAVESQEVRWFSWDDAIGLSDEALEGALVAARREATGVNAAGGPGRRQLPR